MQTNAPYIPHEPGTGEDMSAAPTGILLLRIYCGFQVLFYLLMVGVGVFMIAAPLVDPASFRTSPGEPPIWIFGAVITVLYFPLLVAYGVGVFAPRRPWVYYFGIVVCALSMICGGCWPFAIPTIIYWLKPELKSWLGA